MYYIQKEEKRKKNDYVHFNVPTVLHDKREYCCKMIPRIPLEGSNDFGNMFFFGPSAVCSVVRLSRSKL